MKQTRIGKSTLSSSSLAFGCWRITGTWEARKVTAKARDAGLKAIFAAHEAGYTLYDHADIYCGGVSEELFGLEHEALGRLSTSVQPVKKDFSAVPQSIYSPAYDKQVGDNLLYNEGFKIGADGLVHVVDDNNYASLGVSVNAWQMAQGTPEHKGKIMTGVREALGLKPESPKWKALRKYFMSGDVNEYLGHVTTGADGIEGEITPAQQANRDSVKLTPKQARSLAMWAYDKNLKTLTSNHGFLKPSVYRKFPQLKQLLGDMAYRHGGSFMTDQNKHLGYTAFRDYISHLVGTETELGKQERDPRAILRKAEQRKLRAKNFYGRTARK